MHSQVSDLETIASIFSKTFPAAHHFHSISSKAEIHHPAKGEEVNGNPQVPLDKHSLEEGKERKGEKASEGGG
jgi:hypothetical protein